MKSLETSLASHLNGAVTTLALCARITRRDGVVLGFTGFDRDLVFAGITFQAESALTASAIETTADVRADNLDVQGILSSSYISDADILAGRYDGALVDMFLVNYAALPSSISNSTVVWLLSGRLSEIRLRGQQFVAEVRGLSDALSVSMGELYSPTCRVKRLGDARCGVALAAYTRSYTVAAVLDARRFTHSGAAEADGYFRYGTIKFTSGVNVGMEAVVKSYSGGVFEMVETMPAAVVSGAAFTAIRGCDRQFSTCRDVFNNVTNFRGEPPALLPGVDRLLSPL